MHSINSWVCFLLLSCIGSIHCTCRWLKMYEYDRCNGECVKLLNALGGDVNEFDECPETSTSDLYRHLGRSTEEEKITFLHQTITHIMKLLNRSNVTDTKDKTTLDNLLNVLNRQATELRACVARVLSKEISKKLRRHFRKFRQCLKKNDSPSSWAYTRKEVKDHLRRLLHLANSMLPDYVGRR